MDFSLDGYSMTALRKDSVTVLAVPAFSDNYLWLIHNGVHAVVVDPGDAAPIVAALEKHQLTLVAILLTHHHSDHVGGVAALLQRFPVPVFGPRHEVITGVSHALSEGEAATIPALALQFTVLEVPGHTRGHIAYVEPAQRWLFCGDTLFAGGCGRLFEGTPRQMVDSLAKLTALPDATQVFCAHEYTLSNLRFALAAEPGNLALQARMVAEQAKRDQGLATVPSNIALEKATNPFLRCGEPAIVAHLIDCKRLAKPDPLSAFTALREWKNNFS